MLERESPWLPPWRELLRVYRRLESRGEIRGGRFVAGFTGEQFALPEAIGTLREVRRRPHDNEWPVGVGRRSAQSRRHPDAGAAACRAAGNRLLVQDGVPAAMLSGGEVRLFAEVDPATEWLMRKALLGSMRRHEPEASGTIEPAGTTRAQRSRRVARHCPRNFERFRARSSPRLDLAAMARHIRANSQLASFQGFSRLRDAPDQTGALHPETISQKKEPPAPRRRVSQKPLQYRAAVRTSFPVSDVSFADLGLAEPLLRALDAAKYTVPTPIQARTIPHCCGPRRARLRADRHRQDGGVRAARAAAPRRLEASARSPRGPRALVLAPTRELAVQIGRSFDTYGRGLGLRLGMVFGGVGIGRQIEALLAASTSWSPRRAACST